MGMGAPGVDGGQGIIVVGIVALGQGRLEPCQLIALVLLMERIRIVLGVTGDKNLLAVLGGNGLDACR